MIAFIFMNILAFIVAVIKFVYYTKRNPTATMRHEAAKFYSFKALLVFFDIWGDLMFWLLFFSCMDVFVTYKMQMNAYLLLPELGEASEGYYSAFKIVMAITLAMKTVAVIMKIIEQTNIDVYLVDNEKPNVETKSVNGWRHLFIANEFAELQTELRYTSPETTFIWFAFFWVGLGWEHICDSDPSFNV